MKRKTALTIVTSVGVAAAVGLLVGLVLADDSPLVATDDTVPMVVSYQGEVLVGGEPYSGTGHFKFAVVNAAGNHTYWSNDGTSSGGSVPDTAVSLEVRDGLFAVLLGNTNVPGMTQPLSADVFADRGRRLHVWFSEDGADFTDLGMSVIAAVPYAINAETLDGLDSTAFQQAYDHVVVVAKSGGDYTTIQGALDSITDSGPASRYLVWVAPGTYSETVTMVPYVSIQGAGAELTTISSTVSSPISPTERATVVLTDHVALRDLTVVITGTGKHKVAIVARHVETDTSEIADVVVTGGGGDQVYGIYSYHSSITIRDVHIGIVGDAVGYGIYNKWSSPYIVNVASAGERLDSHGECGGIYNYHGSPTIVDSTASGWCGTPYGYGIVSTYSSVLIQNSIASGSYHAISNIATTATIRDTVAEGGLTGIYNLSYSGTYTMTVDHCRARGDSYAITGSSNYVIYVGASQLDGNVDTDATYHCVGAYDGSYTALNGTCQ